MDSAQRPVRRAWAAARPHAPTLVAAALVAWVSWPVLHDLQPMDDLDGAWGIALQTAFVDGLDFGTDIVFTYGPLGFLREPLLVYPWPARLAFGYGLLVQFALCATLIWGLRRALGSLVAAALVAVLLAAVIFQEQTLVIGFAACVALAAGLAPPSWARVLAVGLGLLCGIELLGKINTGITVTLLGAVAVFAAPAGRRALAPLFGGAALLAAVVGWFATGQSLGAVDDYVRGSLAIISGYSEAMVLEDPLSPQPWEYWAALVIAGLGFVVAYHSGRDLPVRGRAGLLALWAILAFTCFKSGFVRHDLGHANIFFATSLGGLVAFGWAPHRRTTALLIGLLCLTALFASLRQNPAIYVAPFDRAERLVDQALTLSDGTATNDAIAQGRADRAAYEKLEPQVFAGIRGGAVHVDPADAGLPWAQRVRWSPLPVFQAYSAYSNSLDDTNAARLRDRNGPLQVLRENIPAIDGRNAAWDPPGTLRALLCHFRPAATGERWLLLNRSAPRCGREREIATRTVKLGAPTPIPPAPNAQSLVFVRIEGIAVSGIAERLRTTLYRAPQRTTVLDGTRVNRLIPGTAENGLILRVPVRADFPGPYRLDQNARTIAINRGTGRQDGEVELRFFAAPIR